MFDYEVLLYIGQAFFNLSVYTFFVLKAFEHNLKYDRKITLIFACIYVIFSVAIIELCCEDIAPFKIYAPFAMILWAVVSILFARINFKANVMQLIFFVFAIFDISFNVMMVSRAIVASDILSSFIAGDNIAFLLTSIIILILIIPFLWYLCVNLFQRAISLDISAAYWKQLFILPLSYFLFAWLAVKSAFPIEVITPFNLLLILFFLNVSSFLSYVAVLQMLIKTHDSLKATEKANLSEQMNMMQKKQYNDMANNIVKTNKLRHDFRHHLIAIRGYAQSGDLEGLNRYLDEYQKDSFPNEDTPVCSNYFVDIILRHYIGQAKAMGIRVNVATKDLGDFELADTDLCLVFGNLFENAIESCERQKSGDKFIDIKTKSISKSMLAITVTNSYGDIITTRGKLFLSNKHENEGIGIATIQSIAEKNGGSCQLSFENGVFKANVLLVAK
ncbi:MAG: GHKL domain-containing protein [Clostridiales bacterium]